MGQIPIKVSESVRRRNPHIYGATGRAGETGREADRPSAPVASKRIRQSSKPKMNKLETEWFNVLQSTYDGCPILCQAVKLELATGLWYLPDFFIAGNESYPSKSIAWEVKGFHAFGGALEKLKMAARAHLWCKFYLVWKLDGKWQEQEVLP